MKNEIREWLISNNIATVRAYYRGSGDEGSVDEIEFYNTEDKCLSGNDLKSDSNFVLYNDLDLLINSHVYKTFPGWEINGGGSGYWEWDVNTGVVSINHTQLIEENEYAETDWNSIEIPEWIKRNG